MSKKAVKKTAENTSVTAPEQAMRPYKKASRRHILAFVAIIAVFGVASILYSFAATPPKTVVEAESLTYEGDPVILDQSKVTIEGNSNGVATIDLPFDATYMVLTASSETCQGEPHVVVAIDGVQVMDQAVNTKYMQDYSHAVSAVQGRHTISINVSGDVNSDTCDRKVFLDNLSFSGTAPSDGDSASVPVAAPVPAISEVGTTGKSTDTPQTKFTPKGLTGIEAKQ